MVLFLLSEMGVIILRSSRWRGQRRKDKVQCSRKVMFCYDWSVSLLYHLGGSHFQPYLPLQIAKSAILVTCPSSGISGTVCVVPWSKVWCFLGNQFTSVSTDGGRGERREGLTEERDWVGLVHKAHPESISDIGISLIFSWSWDLWLGEFLECSQSHSYGEQWSSVSQARSHPLLGWCLAFAAM